MTATAYYITDAQWPWAPSQPARPLPRRMYAGLHGCDTEHMYGHRRVAMETIPDKVTIINLLVPVAKALDRAPQELAPAVCQVGSGTPMAHEFGSDLHAHGIFVASI